MKRIWLILSLLASGIIAALAEPMQVCALHPLMADLARQVGGERVQVHNLVGEGGNAHRFEPRPADMKRMQSSAIVLASGKGMETYLDRLKSTLTGVTILEVGRTIPSLSVGKDAVYTCCPSHGASSLDPHWWQGVDNMRRAARVVSQAFAEKDPAGKAYYEGTAKSYGQNMDALKRWAKGELAKIPRDQRKLVTAHNAFAYFGKEFGFEVIAVAGLSKEQNTTPKEQAAVIEAVKKSNVRALFGEQNSNEKSIRAIAAATGTRVGGALISDGAGTGKNAGFKGMIEHNVNTITRALATP